MSIEFELNRGACDLQCSEDLYADAQRSYVDDDDDVFDDVLLVPYASVRCCSSYAVDIHKML